ncbi:MAG: hypothetical protein WCH62_08095, partial [Candidatus Omnitrophota bacterium]
MNVIFIAIRFFDRNVWIHSRDSHARLLQILTHTFAKNVSPVSGAQFTTPSTSYQGIASSPGLRRGYFRDNKKADPKGTAFLLVAGTGFEPMTSRL